MITLEATVVLKHIESTPDSNSCLKGILEIAGERCEAIIKGKYGRDICFGNEENVTVIISSGECLLLDLIKSSVFKLYCGESVGTGKVISINEIYLEYGNMCRVSSLEERRKIVGIAKILDNVVIHDDVYQLVE